MGQKYTSSNIASTAANTARIYMLESDIHEIKKKLDKVITFVDETRGGHKYLWGVLSITATLGALIGSLVTYITKGIM